MQKKEFYCSNNHNPDKNNFNEQKDAKVFCKECLFFLCDKCKFKHVHSKNIVEVAERLQDIGIAAISIHGRTRAQMYKGAADWTLIGEVKNNPRMKIPVFCNGDIDSPERAYEVKNVLGLDGAMIGRAAIGYPWFFNEVKHFLATGEKLSPPTVSERVNVCRTHLIRSMSWKGNTLGILEMQIGRAHV